jgi:hypothetical protein
VAAAAVVVMKTEDITQEQVALVVELEVVEIILLLLVLVVMKEILPLPVLHKEIMVVFGTETSQAVVAVALEQLVQMHQVLVVHLKVEQVEQGLPLSLLGDLLLALDKMLVEHSGLQVEVEVTLDLLAHKLAA